MFKNRKLIRGLVAKVTKAEGYVLDAFEQGRVEQEPALTDRLLASLEHQLDGSHIGGVTWTAKTLKDRGAGSQESEFGADFMAVFHASLPDFEVTKGFLAQSKILEPSQAFPASDAQRLKDQCEKMLDHSPASYVFLYSQQSGVLVVPAVDIVAARNSNPHELNAMPMGKFYEKHFECFIGDRAIRAASPTVLNDLRAKFQARKLFLLSGKKSIWGSARDS